MDPKAAVVTPISPQVEQQRDRAGYEELWRDLVSAKAHVAELRNIVAAQDREIENLRIYVRRHVKRLDAVASRLEAAAARIRG